MNIPEFNLHKRPEALASPCTGVCQMDAATGYCKGCLRTIDEIIDWGLASESRKRDILAAVERRRVAP